MLFSVTIPAYKTAFLEEAIESILSQSFKDFEIIIVDDCSPNDIKSIVDKFTDNRIRYFRNEKNCGAIDVVDNWNICLSYAKGEYIICMGDDDKMLPCCLEEYYNIIKQNPEIGVVHGWTEIINEQSSVTSLTAKRCERESAISLIWHRWNVYKDQYVGDFCYNTYLLRELGGFFKLPLAWASDDITAIMAACKNGIINTNKRVFQYRINTQTITNSGNYDIKMNAIILEEKWYQSFLETIDIKSEEDFLFSIMIKKQMRNHFIAKKIYTISSDLKNSKWKLFYWIAKRKLYKLSYKRIFKAFIKSL